MACNNEAKRLFERFKHQLPQAIRAYRLSLTGDATGHMIHEMICDMPNGEDKEQLKRVLNCKAHYSVREDKYGNRRYAIPFGYFMKEGRCDEDFVRKLIKDLFHVYGCRERYATTDSSHYEPLTKSDYGIGV